MTVQDKNTGDNTRQGKTKQNKASQDKTTQDIPDDKCAEVGRNGYGPISLHNPET